MKKLALLIGGEPRFIEKSFRKNIIFWNWLNENYNVDVHVHSWNHKLEWNKKDHQEIRYTGDRTSENYYPKNMTTKWIKDISTESIQKEFSVYNPKTLVVEEYDAEKYTINEFPFGQYISRSKAYTQAVNTDTYDYVWVTRSDCVYDSNYPVMFKLLEETDNQVLCEETKISQAGHFTTQDWFYAGQTALFNNLKLFADDFENYYDNNIESKEWYKKLQEEGSLRNSHIWQGLIANNLGEDVFIETAQKWILLHDE